MARDLPMAAHKTARSSSLAPWLGIAALVILLDQLTKVLIVKSFHLGASMTVTSFFNIVRVHNEGAAFSFLAGAAGWQRWLFIGLGLAAAVFIVWMLSRHGGQRLFSLALALILGGALGNVIDRLHAAKVTDFIQVFIGSYPFPVFNVADSAISVGAVALIAFSLFSGEKKPA